MDPLVPSDGWGVLHLFYRLDGNEPEGTKRVIDAIDAARADGVQVIAFSVLGHKADFGLMAVGPDLARLAELQAAVAEGPVTPTYSYVSLTERSEYTSTEDDEWARLTGEQGLTDDAEIETQLAVWRDRMEHYLENRLHPQLPAKRVLCFYPMSKRRQGEDNWFTLTFDERKRLMQGHARVGRTYAGRVLQLITGSTGLDDWEWGVTLFADDPVALKEIVYEMRFDEVSARYAEFGPFIVGVIGEPAEIVARIGGKG